ncbi:MAG TPA: M20 family metallopeptidase [Candidatus Saccharimonadales bacterium]|jgi:acetylornithine deacetylase/succinyl-diaminopimelate desuccinylase-like protein|nr:M20 family metallopeptidase [Candidatus Saccharimonadales bacterium]
MKKDLFISQLTKLVSFETVTGNVAENSKALDYVESLLNPKVIVKRYKIKTAEVLIAGNVDTMSPDIAYLAHIDVVSAKPKEFKLHEEGDKLFGRGTSDMKFSIPMGIALLNKLITDGSKLSFALAITTDEETGGEEGCDYLAKELEFRPHSLIVPDGGENLSFVNRAKGVCWLDITSTGSPAHASRPWKGKNALEPIILLGKKLIEIYGKNSLKENWETTMNIGQIQGGISVNQVCPEAIMRLDFRYPEGDSIEKITKKASALAAEIGPDIKVEISSTTLPTFTDTNLPVVKDFLNSMGKAFGKKIVIKPTYGASDASHFAKYRIPVLMMKPLGGEIHSSNEWVSLESCLTFYKGLEIFLDKIGKNT